MVYGISQLEELLDTLNLPSVSQRTATVIPCLLLLDGSLPGENVPLGGIRPLVPLTALLRAGTHAQSGRMITAAVKGGGLPVDTTSSWWLEQGALPGGPLDQAGGIADDPGRRRGASSSSTSSSASTGWLRSRSQARSHWAHSPHTAA